MSTDLPGPLQPPSLSYVKILPGPSGDVMDVGDLFQGLHQPVH